MATTGAARRQTLRDLAEEAKKRAVLFLVFAVGLAYLMSLTSSSVWINLPVATAMIVLFRYISLDYDIRRKSMANNIDPVISQPVKMKNAELHKVFPQKKERPDWKNKVKSLPVEAAFEKFTRHLVSEWITDLWYSRITPDKEGPEELIFVINSVLGEISARARDVNLINLLTRDVIDLISINLELYRSCQAKIGKEKFVKLPTERRDAELKMTLVAENKLHPALFSANAEHKVLQNLAEGLISFTLKPQDLQCSFFRYTARELLACAVIRPVLNLANPRFINERIESLALSHASKAEKGPSSEEVATVKQREPPMPSVDELSALMDRTSGVELMQFRHDDSRNTSDTQLKKTKNPSSLKPISADTHVRNDSHPLESSFLPSRSHIYSDTGMSLHSQNSMRKNVESSEGEWAETLAIISQRKNQALAPEHLENMWTKGKNYKKENVNHVAKLPVRATTSAVQQSAVPSSIHGHAHNVVPHKETMLSHGENQHLIKGSAAHAAWNGANYLPKATSEERAENANYEEVGLDSDSSNATEDDENNNVTGIDSPGTRVWESKSKGNVASHVHHPLESSDFHKAMKSRSHIGKLKMSRSSSGRHRSRSSSLKVPLWQEVERASFFGGDDSDILNTSAIDSRSDELNDDAEVESLARTFSGANASSLSLASTDSSYSSNYSTTNVLEDSYLKLRCEVIGANIVKSGSGMFAVYSISVTDANSNSWSIKRRFRHFEELHRRLKEYPQYNLSLPPKHFLSSGLEVPVVRERCKLLDIYLKKLLQIPTVSSCIEVWDFLSVDSQTYMFLDSLSIIQTLSVNLDDKPIEKGAKLRNSAGALDGRLASAGQASSASKHGFIQKDASFTVADGLRFRKGNNVYKRSTDMHHDNSESDSEQNDFSFSINLDKSKKVLSGETDSTQEAAQFLEADEYTNTHNEWMAPNLSVPIFHLVDVVFQLQDGGWIRRQAFWVAKQLLQLGMGDTFDDWLIEKIQLLRRGTVIASAVRRVEQILWPDGIFITKHPKRKAAASLSSTNGQNNGMANSLTDEQQLEAARRAKFVRELIIDKAPSALVSLVGRKEYERSAQDMYFFLQSPVCLKQLAFELLELLVLAAFPELDDIVKKWHEDKEQFRTLE